MAKKSSTESASAPKLSPLCAKLRKAYAVACPIVTLTTSDPAQSIRDIVETLSDSYVVTWDIAKAGSFPVQPNQQEAEAAIGRASGFDMSALNLTEFLIGCERLPGSEPGSKTKGTVVVIKNANRYLDDPAVVQQIWNLRDIFKYPKRMLVLMGSSIKLPEELTHDAIELDEPLPDHTKLRGIVDTLCKDAGIEVEATLLDDAAAAARGMSAFGAEQLAALNFSKASGGVNVRGVWSDKCQKINEVPGLKVITGGTFDDVAGVEQIKRFMRGILNGQDKPRCIVFVDEIEKSLGGADSDTSGVSQDQLGTILQYMQDHRAAGILEVGAPGTCKSALAKAAGGEVGIPTIQFDLGGMKDSLVGGSEGRIRQALKVIDAVSGGKTIWIATCNSLTALPPELRRRFKYGTWFFDLPTKAERSAIWDLYTVRYDLPIGISESLLDMELSGAEIESVCEIAWRIGCTTDEAVNYIVPVSRAGAKQLDALRAMADGALLSASEPGVYTRKSENKATENVGRPTRVLS